MVAADADTLICVCWGSVHTTPTCPWRLISAPRLLNILLMHTSAPFEGGVDLRNEA